jgi:hypothetical protein
VFRITFGWTGGAPVTYQVLDQLGQWITFHKIKWNNNNTTPNMLNATLPMTMYTSSNSSGSLFFVETASWSAGLVETPSQSSQRYFSAAQPTATTIAATSTETHLLTIQNNTTYNGFTNVTEARLVFVTGGQVSTSSEAMILNVRKNATVTGTSFTSVNSNSIMSYSTAGTYTAATGTLVLSVPVGTYGNGPIGVLIPQATYQVLMEPGDIITVTGTSLSGTGTTAVCSLAWEERF